MFIWKKLMDVLTPEKEVLPEFEASKVIRYHLIFEGLVQGVGFRIEVYQMALKLGLTGWVRNRSDASVEAEIQGEQKKVDYLIEHMQKLPRASVEKVEQKEMKLLDKESQFKIR